MKSNMYYKGLFKPTISHIFENYLITLPETAYWMKGNKGYKIKLQINQ